MRGVLYDDMSIDASDQSMSYDERYDAQGHGHCRFCLLVVQKLLDVI